MFDYRGTDLPTVPLHLIARTDRLELRPVNSASTPLERWENEGGALYGAADPAQERRHDAALV